MFRVCLLCSVLIICWSDLSGQTRFEVNAHLPENYNHLSSSLQLPSRRMDSVALSEKLKQLLQKLHQEGYREAMVLFEKSHQWEVYWKPGPYYFVKHLKAGESLENNIFWKEFHEYWIDRRFHLDTFEKSMQEFAYGASDDDWPAQIRLDHMDYRQIGIDSIGVTLILKSSSFQIHQLDSIKLRKTGRINRGPLIKILGIENPGDISMKEVYSIPERLSNFTSLELEEAPTIIARKGGLGILDLSFKSMPKDKFDILIGLIPGNSTNSTRLSAWADVSLFSPFRQGERLTFNYEGLSQGSQELYGSLEVPFIFRSPFLLSFDGNIRKREEDFLNLGAKLGLAVYLKNNWMSQITLGLKSSRILKSGLLDSLSANTLSDNNINSVGIGITKGMYDLAIKERDQYWHSLSFSWGRNLFYEGGKEIANQDRQSQTSLTLNGRLGMEKILAKEWAVFVQLAAYYLSQRQYFLNDFDWLGGAKTIRGFNENSFVANQYAYINTECRWLFEGSSYIYFLTDVAYIGNSLEERDDFVYAFGTGLQLKTRSSWLNITYAIGAKQDEGLGFSRGRVHIGLTNKF